MVVDLERLGVDYLLVNSTNEFLAEYPDLKENARYSLTKFSGSTGDALVCADGRIYLFVDGRYHTQAEREIGGDITLVKLQTGQKQDDEIRKLIPDGATLGIVAEKNSQSRVESFKGINIKLLNLDPVNFYTDINYNKIELLPLNLCGKSFEEKTAGIPRPFFLSNQEEVSYLINSRDFSKNYSSKIQGKLLLTDYENVLFTNMDADKIAANLEILPLDRCEEILGAIDYPVFVDKSSTNAKDYAALRYPEHRFSPVREMKSVKTAEEIESYKRAFKLTDEALLATRDFIMGADVTSEYEIAEVLEKNFLKTGARSLSFKSIVAKDKNSALAHYSKNAKEEIVKDGSLVLIDCGAYYENGLATDITRVFFKGEPEEEHRRIYTFVLKMFLNAFNAKITDGLSGYDIDKIARDMVNNNPIAGYTFGHGLGHGLGINVHEAPPNLSTSDIAKTSLKNGMCFTIEPGLYNSETFGVRLENSCYFAGNKIHSFSRMPYEKKLIDFGMLSTTEKSWLEEFPLI